MAGRVTHVAKAVVHEPNQDKPRYVLVGRATTDDLGRVSIKIDALPYDLTKWTGWINLFPLDDNDPPF